MIGLESTDYDRQAASMVLPKIKHKIQIRRRMLT